MKSTDIKLLINEIEALGFITRGIFEREPHDPLPITEDHKSYVWGLLIGNAGGEMWRHFVRSAEYSSEYLDDIKNPLDHWTKKVLTPLASENNGCFIHPSDGPNYAPFQQWAFRAEGVKPSPLGIVIHPEYGLWHAYRGAVLFETPMPLKDSYSNHHPSHPCDDCKDKPCLSTCPVSALSIEDGYSFTKCIGHLKVDESRECVDGGCLARRACPVGQKYRYSSDQQKFHQKAFTRNYL